MLSVKRFSFGIFGIVLSSSSVSYIAPSLSIALKMIGFSPDHVGLTFCIPALLYIVTCLLTPLITQKLPKRLVIAIGFHILAVAMFMIGSDGSFVRINPGHIILAGLFFLGVAAAMIVTPITPEQQEAIEQQNKFNYDPEDFATFLSSLFLSCTAIGETIGPFASSILN